MSMLQTLIVLVLLLVLLWQLWRSRLPWRWRLLWPFAIAGMLLMLLPPSWQRPQQALVVLTPGDLQAAANAQLWAQQNNASVIAFPTHPTLTDVQSLQSVWYELGEKRLHLFGYGFSEAAWQQQPARTVIWHPPATPVWQLDVSENVRLGDPVVVKLLAPTSAKLLQLVDSRDQVLVDSPMLDGQAGLSFLPAAVGHYDWRLHVRDAEGVLLRDIPIAFTVSDVMRFEVAGHFAAPSFEQRALRDWFQRTGMRGEFVTRTGQLVTRRDQFNHEASAPERAADLHIWDLRSWQVASAANRQQLLQQVANGKTLVLLSDGSEAEQATRTALSKSMAVTWRALREPEQKMTHANVALHRASWLPQALGEWRFSDVDDAVLWRSWQHGKIVWQGVTDSHRLWQRSRQQYASWWQRVLQMPADTQPRWHSPGSGIVRQPALLCVDELPLNAEDGETEKNLQLRSPAGEVLPLPLQFTAWPGRRCSLFTPSQEGWYTLQTPVRASWRVFAQAPLPEQLAHHAFAATAQHSQVVAPPADNTRQPMPLWPFFGPSLIAFGLIWWRERQLMPS